MKRRARVTSEFLDVAAHEAAVASSRCGAVVTFTGVVRDHDQERQVTSLHYSAHPDAEVVLAEIAGEAIARSYVVEVAVSHRVGDLRVGEVALVCAVSAPHRREAFETAAWLVEEVKRRLPVWKRQDFADGSHEWVNCA